MRRESQQTFSKREHNPRKKEMSSQNKHRDGPSASEQPPIIADDDDDGDQEQQNMMRQQSSAEEIVAANEQLLQKEVAAAAAAAAVAAETETKDQIVTIQRLVCCGFLLGKCKRDKCNFDHQDNDATPCQYNGACTHNHWKRKWPANDDGGAATSSAVSACRCCGSEFGTLTNRPHHCRRCAALVDDQCLSTVGDRDEAIRICSRCLMASLLRGSCPRTPPTRSSFLSWVPTDEQQLRTAELMLVAPLFRQGWQQYFCAGLNTFSLRAFAHFAGPNTDPDSSPLSPLPPQKPMNSSSSISSNCGSKAAASSPPQFSNKEPSPAAAAPPGAAASADEKSSKTPKKTVRVRLHHFVIIHGFAGAAALFFPNLKDLGARISRLNKARLEALLSAPPSSAENKNNNDNKNGGSGTTNNNNNNNNSSRKKKKNNRGKKTFLSLSAAASAIERNEDDQEGTQQQEEFDIEFFVLHSFDLPGFARSQRSTNVKLDGVDSVIALFTKSFDEFFLQNKMSDLERWIDPAAAAAVCGKNEVEFVPCPAQRRPFKLTFAGHSFGAYLAAHYARQRAPPPPPLMAVEDEERGQDKSGKEAKIEIDHLILVDPFGVAVFDENKKEHTLDSLNWKWKMAASYLQWSESLITLPLRLAGPWAPSALMSRRPDFVERVKSYIADPMCVFDFIFHSNAQAENLGDRAFTHVVRGRAFAWRPLCEFVSIVEQEKRNNQPQQQQQQQQSSFLTLPPTPPLPNSVTLSMCYGAWSWMDKAAGSKMFDERAKRCPDNPNGGGIFALIPDAGHQVALDNPEEFDAFILECLGVKEEVDELCPGGFVK